MDKLEQIRRLADDILLGIADPVERRQGYIHLYGVSSAAGLLALKRGLGPQLGMISGILHDLYRYKTGLAHLHDQNGAEYLRPILRDMGIFSDEELRVILSAIFHHSDKKNYHQPYSELLKDADILQYFLDDPSQAVPHNATRLQRILPELALPFTNGESIQDPPDNIMRVDKPMLSRLAEVAENLAKGSIIGDPADSDFRSICRYWPDKNIFSDLKGGWCAAFIYHCCSEAGIRLPIRHPQVKLRFTAVKAWLEWAKLDETNFFYSPENIEPKRGDIVVFDKLVSDNLHDHIGIVLSSDGNCMDVAEGNADNKNVSRIVYRCCRQSVAGFIRIKNKYNYEPTGHTYNLELTC